MSFIPVMEYIVSYIAFGITYWLLFGIMGMFIDSGVHYPGDTYNLLHYYWEGVVLVFIVFTGIYVVRKYQKFDRTGGY